MNITISGEDYNNFIGKYTGAMMSYGENNFTIIFEPKDALKKADLERTADIVPTDELELPLVILSQEEEISSCIPNVRILYNNNLNVESVLTGYILGKMFRNEITDDFKDLVNSNIDEILNDDNVKEELKPLIIDAEFADDFDFSKLEDQMFNIIDKKIKSL